MMRPSDFPIRWARGFGWGSWRAFWRLMFPSLKVIPGYTILPVASSPWWSWPASKLRRLSWAIRGPV